MKKDIDKIESLICIGSKDVFMMGICGIVGIRKSTTASVISHRLYKQSDRYRFIDNAGEWAERSELILLRQQIRSAITFVGTNSPVSMKE